MTEVYELELWSKPGLLLPLEYGNKLKDEIDLKLSLKETIYCGLSFIPSETDSENLLRALNEKELVVDKFTDFCKKENLVPSIKNVESAARYLEFSYGRELAWLHLPYNKEGLEYYFSISEWAINNNFNIQGSNELYCVKYYKGVKPINW